MQDKTRQDCCSRRETGRAGALIALLALAGSAGGCGEGLKFDPEHVGHHVGAQRCTGQYDKVVTTNFLGPQEDTNSQDPTIVGHAAAAELTYLEAGFPAREQFAVAWVKSDNPRTIYAARYSTVTKAFVGGVQELEPYASIGWVQPMGFDDNCIGIAGQATCGWFTWEEIDGWVGYRAIAPNGQVSTYRYFHGHQPSGDSGQRYVSPGVIERRKLIAYLNQASGGTDRTEIRARLLDGAGNSFYDFRVGIVDPNYKAYQTQVAWAVTEGRWLVVWSENQAHRNPSERCNGTVWSRTVDFDGNLGNYNFIEYCEGETSVCGFACAGGSSASAGVAKGVSIVPAPAPRTEGSGGNVILQNPQCICKGLWLASSDFSSASDRFRLEQYKKHARLSSTGSRVAMLWIEGAGFGTYGALARSSAYTPQGYAPFQMLYHLPSGPTQHYRLVQDSFTSVAAGDVNSAPYEYPQGLRSGNDVSAAISAGPSGSIFGLRLGVVDMRSNGCPP